MVKTYINKNQYQTLDEYILNIPFIRNNTWDYIKSLENTRWNYDVVTNTIKVTHTVPTKA